MKNYKPLTKEERKQKEDEKILLMAELWEKGIENNEKIVHEKQTREDVQKETENLEKQKIFTRWT